VTACAIRPTALVLQTSNGKGLTQLSAKVSALMEAIELYHAENPLPQQLRRDSWNGLARQGLYGIKPSDLPAYDNGFFSADYLFDWVRGEALVSQKEIWLPASAVYFCEHSLYRTSTHGLASGNHLVEATLHALYELIERDAISSLEIKGRLKIKEKCKIIDLNTITDESLQKVFRKLKEAQTKLILLWIPSCVPVHTFWAILLNQAPFTAVSTFNAGCGTHLDLTIAATRAITEAVQSRLALVHGSREDIISRPVYKAAQPESNPAYLYFDQLEADTTWQMLEPTTPRNQLDLQQDYLYLLAQLAQAGHHHIFRVDLTNPTLNIPVVKVIIPSLRFNRSLF